MFRNNNGESRVEILKNRIDAIIRKKNKEVNELDKSISFLEKELKNAGTDIEMLEYNLGRLKHDRETVEIECFKNIMKYHKEILKYQNRDNGCNETR